MCIVFMTTAHPDYAYIIIDNRDEFILRPTTRPEWWTHETGSEVLSARDMQRVEKGTWLGVTRTGALAVLTNYAESSKNDSTPAIRSKRSRGGMVTTWLGLQAHENTTEVIEHLLDGGVLGVGGFSMLCGKLRRTGTKSVAPLAIVSNKCEYVGHVTWVGESRNGVYGLSNVAYDDPDQWPKVTEGKHILAETVKEASTKGWDREKLIEALFGLLDRDTFPKTDAKSLWDMVGLLKHSIYIPPIGDDEHKRAMEAVSSQGRGEWASNSEKAAEILKGHGRPESAVGFDTGMYGTQRQTVILVDWDGNVTFRERALWDGNGNPIPRGQADVKHEFQVEGWFDEMKD